MITTLVEEINTILVIKMIDHNGEEKENADSKRWSMPMPSPIRCWLRLANLEVNNENFISASKGVVENTSLARAQVNY